MTILPEPLTPPDCDLRGYEYMPLVGQRFFQSRLYSRALRNPRAGLAAVKLWWAAWLECPAGSLPDDDEDLAMLADFGTDMKSWRAVRDIALHGFVRCSDGRLYHPLLCDEAVKAFDYRLKADVKRETDRERLRKWREDRKKRHCSPPQSTDGSEGETPDETRLETYDETPNETRVVGGRRDQTLPNKRELKLSLGSAAAEAEFAEFWGKYPRKVAKDEARKAYEKARKRASAGEIIAAVMGQKWNPNPKYIPHAATWLNNGRWQDEPDPSIEVEDPHDRMSHWRLIDRAIRDQNAREGIFDA